jgi:hypothetical protein
MPRRPVDKAYHSMTPAELFRLAIAADARLDAAERDRLIRACPRVPLLGRDPEFALHVEGAWRLVDRLSVCCAAALGALETVEDLERVVIPDARSGRTLDRDMRLVLFALEEIRHRALVGIRSLLDAFSGVCREIAHLDSDHLLAAFCPGLVQALAPYRQAARTVEASPEIRRTARASLKAAWLGATEPLRRGA